MKKDINLRIEAEPNPEIQDMLRELVKSNTNLCTEIRRLADKLEIKWGYKPPVTQTNLKAYEVPLSTTPKIKRGLNQNKLNTVRNNLMSRKRMVKISALRKQTGIYHISRYLKRLESEGEIIRKGHRVKWLNPKDRRMRIPPSELSTMDKIDTIETINQLTDVLNHTPKTDFSSIPPSKDKNFLYKERLKLKYPTQASMELFASQNKYPYYPLKVAKELPPGGFHTREALALRIKVLKKKLREGYK